MAQWQIEGKILGNRKLTIHTNIYTGSSLFIGVNLTLSATECTMFMSLTNICTARYSYLSSVQLNRTSFVLYRNILFHVSGFVFFLSVWYIRHNGEWQGIMGLLRWCIWWFFKECNLRGWPSDHIFGFGHSIAQLFFLTRAHCCIQCTVLFNNWNGNVCSFMPYLSLDIIFSFWLPLLQVKINNASSIKKRRKTHMKKYKFALP